MQSLYVARKVTTSAALCLMTMLAKGQQLQIGDTLPDLELQVQNYSKSTVKLSDFADKAIILDFWNTRCINCIKGFPKIDSLQSQYGDKLQFILVNKESKNITQAFFSKKKNIRAPSVPTVSGDTSLHALFRFYGYPYSVWLDQDRVMRQGTGAYNVSAAHLEKFLTGSLPKLKGSIKWKLGDALTTLDSNHKNRVLYYSYITKCIRGLMLGGTRIPKPSNEPTVRLSRTCGSIVELYKQAYGEDKAYPFEYDASVELDVNDAYQYARPHDGSVVDEWKDNYAFNYDLLLPMSKASEGYRIMQDDLRRFFDLDVSIIKKKTEGIVLNRISGDLHPSSGGGKMFDRFMVGDSMRVLRNVPFKVFSQHLADLVRYSLKVPFRDDTEFSQQMDISLKSEILDPVNIQELNGALKCYGLRLDYELIEIDVLRLAEKRR